MATPLWNRITQRPNDPTTSLTADEVAWLSVELIKNPAATAADLALIKPRKEVVIKPHAPFERYPNVIAIAHESPPYRIPVLMRSAVLIALQTTSD